MDDDYEPVMSDSDTENGETQVSRIWNADDKITVDHIRSVPVGDLTHPLTEIHGETTAHDIVGQLDCVAVAVHTRLLLFTEVLRTALRVLASSGLIVSDLEQNSIQRLLAKVSVVLFGENGAADAVAVDASAFLPATGSALNKVQFQCLCLHIALSMRPYVTDLRECARCSHPGTTTFVLNQRLMTYIANMQVNGRNNLFLATTRAAVVLLSLAGSPLEEKELLRLSRRVASRVLGGDSDDDGNFDPLALSAVETLSSALASFDSYLGEGTRCACALAHMEVLHDTLLSAHPDPRVLPREAAKRTVCLPVVKAFRIASTYFPRSALDRLLGKDGAATLAKLPQTRHVHIGAALKRLVCDGLYHAPGHSALVFKRKQRTTTTIASADHTTFNNFVGSKRIGRPRRDAREDAVKARMESLDPVAERQRALLLDDAATAPVTWNALPPWSRVQRVCVMDPGEKGHTAAVCTAFDERACLVCVLAMLLLLKAPEHELPLTNDDETNTALLYHRLKHIVLGLVPARVMEYVYEALGGVLSADDAWACVLWCSCDDGASIENMPPSCVSLDALLVSLPPEHRPAVASAAVEVAYHVGFVYGFTVGARSVLWDARHARQRMRAHRRATTLSRTALTAPWRVGVYAVPQTRASWPMSHCAVREAVAHLYTLGPRSVEDAYCVGADGALCERVSHVAALFGGTYDSFVRLVARKHGAGVAGALSSASTAGTSIHNQLRTAVDACTSSPYGSATLRDFDGALAAARSRVLELQLDTTIETALLVVLEHRCLFLAAEVPVVDREQRVAGTVDVLCLTEREGVLAPCVLDWKTISATADPTASAPASLPSGFSAGTVSAALEASREVVRSGCRVRPAHVAQAAAYGQLLAASAAAGVDVVRLALEHTLGAPDKAQEAAYEDVATRVHDSRLVVVQIERDGDHGCSFHDVTVPAQLVQATLQSAFADCGARPYVTAFERSLDQLDLGVPSARTAVTVSACFERVRYIGSSFVGILHGYYPQLSPGDAGTCPLVENSSVAALPPLCEWAIDIASRLAPQWRAPSAPYVFEPPPPLDDTASEDLHTRTTPSLRRLRCDLISSFTECGPWRGRGHHRVRSRAARQKGAEELAEAVVRKATLVTRVTRAEQTPRQRRWLYHTSGCNSRGVSDSLHHALDKRSYGAWIDEHSDQLEAPEQSRTRHQEENKFRHRRFPLTKAAANLEVWMTEYCGSGSRGTVGLPYKRMCKSLKVRCGRVRFQREDYSTKVSATDVGADPGHLTGPRMWYTVYNHNKVKATDTVVRRQKRLKRDNNKSVEIIEIRRLGQIRGVRVRGAKVIPANNGYRRQATSSSRSPVTHDVCDTDNTIHDLIEQAQLPQSAAETVRAALAPGGALAPAVTLLARLAKDCDPDNSAVTALLAAVNSQKEYFSRDGGAAQALRCFRLARSDAHMYQDDGKRAHARKMSRRLFAWN